MKKNAFSYSYIMKKFAYALLLVPFLLFLAACGGGYDYTKHLSEVKSDIFRAETDDFSVTVTCISREHPYASDGITCPLSDLVEIVVIPTDKADADYSVFLLGDCEIGGEMSFRSVEDDWFYSESITEFPKGSVSIRLERGEQKWEFLATSVKNEATMSATEALKVAVEHEKEAVDRLTENGAFQGEFRVRLLRRDVNYYYVGIVSKDGNTISLLLAAESGEILARRENG